MFNNRSGIYIETDHTISEEEIQSSMEEVISLQAQWQELWFPKTFGKETRWLRKVIIKSVYVTAKYSFSKNKVMEGRWVEKEFYN